MALKDMFAKAWGPRRSFFLPVKVVSRVFRGKFVAGLKTAFHAGALMILFLLPWAESRQRKATFPSARATNLLLEMATRWVYAPR